MNFHEKNTKIIIKVLQQNSYYKNCLYKAYKQVDFEKFSLYKGCIIKNCIISKFSLYKGCIIKNCIISNSVSLGVNLSASGRNEPCVLNVKPRFWDPQKTRVLLYKKDRNFMNNLYYIIWLFWPPGARELNKNSYH